MRLGEMRAAVTAGLEKALQAACAELGPIPVLTHPGRFDMGELQRVALRAPCVLVTVLDVVGARIAERAWLITPRFGAYVLATDQPGRRRDEIALDLVARLYTKIIGSDWDEPALFQPVLPENLRADNLFFGQLDQKGVALWGLTWLQPLTL